MKKLNLDLFKLLIVLIFIWIGYSIHNFSKNRRYINIANWGILDTKTGKTYKLDYDKKMAIEYTKEVE